MAFSNELVEIGFKKAEKLLEDFNPNIDKHSTCIQNPEAGDCFFIYIDDVKQKGQF